MQDIQELNLSSWGYGDRNINSLIEKLKLFPNIKKLNLYRNNIGSIALDSLVPALLALQQLKLLNLGYNNISDDNVAKLTPIIEKGLLDKLILTTNTGLTEKSLALIDQWRQTGLVVETYHTVISPLNVLNNAGKEKLVITLSI